jgi:ribosomal protein S18 acetylase RimI-like enzyme
MSSRGGRGGKAATVRRATVADAADIGRLLHDFNSEFADASPGPAALAEHLPRLLDEGDALILLVGDGPDGIAMSRFRRSIWTDELDAYLEELYVAPSARGNGLGRALMAATMDAARSRGATYLSLVTSTDDTAARGLYESSGFTNREGGPDGPVMLFYERDL